MRRNKNTALIGLLILFLMIFIVVNAIRHIRIYMVYSSGLTPLLVIGMIILTIVILFFRGSKQRR